MASWVNDREEESAKHASCSQFTEVTQSKQEPVQTLRYQRAYQEKREQSLVFMLGIRGATVKSHSVSSRHPQKTEIKGGEGDGKSGGGRKAGTLTTFTGPQRVKCYQLPCTRAHSLPSCTTDTISKQRKPWPEHSLLKYTINQKKTTMQLHSFHLYSLLLV